MHMSEQRLAATGRLSLRLAGDEGDVADVQRLRWRVFHAERSSAEPRVLPDCLDCDVYDPLCDHLLVIDEDAERGERVVGTYRLLRESVAAASFGFYSSGEFDIGMLCSGPGRPRGELLELGRSCVLPAYRTSATISLLWRGIAEYISRHGIGMMFGCASFPGTSPEEHAAALSYLHHHHLASEPNRPRVLHGKGITMARLERGSYDPKQALLRLPPLVKAYLRVGARFGDGAFIDHDFGTIDVCVVMPVEQITSRYAARFNVAA